MELVCAEFLKLRALARFCMQAPRDPAGAELSSAECGLFMRVVLAHSLCSVSQGKRDAA